MQRAQELLATHVSMAQQRPASGSTQQRPGSGANSGVSSGSSTHREAAGADGQAVIADAAELEADVQLTQLRLVMQGMLQELRMLDAQNPGMAVVLMKAVLWVPGWQLADSADGSNEVSSSSGRICR